MDTFNPPQSPCPHCHRETMAYRFMTPDNHCIITHRCNHCQQDVMPSRNIICNPPLVTLSAIG